VSGRVNIVEKLGNWQMQTAGRTLKRWFKYLWTAPVFEGDPEKTNIGKHLHAMTWFSIIATTFYIIALPIVAPQLAKRILLVIPLLILQVPILAWALRGRVKEAAIVSLTSIWVAFGFGSAISGGVRSAIYSGNIVLILTAAIMLGKRIAFGFAGLSLIEGIILVWAEYRGVLPPLLTTPLSSLLTQAMYFIVGAGSLYLANYSIKEALDKASHELSERHLVEKELRDSEQRYRLISTVASDYMFSTRLGTDNELHLDWVAGAFEQITGFTFEEYIDRGGWRSLLYPDDIPLDDHALETLQANKTVVHEIRCFHKDGSVRWMRVYAHPVWDRSLQKLTGIYGAVQDITERKDAEAEREKLINELEAKNTELERFTYTVSHDLKSPLVTIRGFLGYIEKDIMAGNTERLQADMARIADATNRMQRILNELLELSRIGRMKNPSEAVSFEAIVNEAVELVRGRLEAHQVQIEIKPGLPVVYGDRVRLVEVVQNLLDNSCKFMGGQPHPGIQVGSNGTDPDGKPILFIQDNGTGIDPQFHDRVFGLFNKLDPQSEGTGIGLALVKRIIEVHQGKIWIESQGSGSGTTFYFTLPVPD
jgi:PAS domain S-box-containing protein